MRYTACLVTVLFVFSGFLSTCGSSDNPPPRRRARKSTSKKPSRRKKPAPAAKDLDAASVFEQNKNTYTYNPSGKRDPFLPYSGGLVKDKNLPRSPLERYKLTELTLTGIVWGLADCSSFVACS